MLHASLLIEWVAVIVVCIPSYCCMHRRSLGLRPCPDETTAPLEAGRKGTAARPPRRPRTRPKRLTK